MTILCVSTKLVIILCADTVLVNMNAVVTWQLQHWPTHVQQWHLAGGCCVKMLPSLVIAMSSLQQLSQLLVPTSHQMALFSLPLFLALLINLALHLQ
jgi:hypothetical protein